MRRGIFSLDAIDFVFPYVNSADPVWINTYRKYSIENNLHDRLVEINNERFRDCSFIKYILRGIAQNMPFIRNVYLIVSNPTQVPDYINQNKVKIVLHSDIIPEEHLPTFNSETIEKFLINIPDLAPRFLYSNDDCVIMRPCVPNDFFDEDTGCAKILFNKFNTNRADLYTQSCINSYNMAAKVACVDIDCQPVVRPEHDITPMFYSSLEAIFPIINMHTGSYPAFRSPHDFNQYIYSFYSYFQNKTLTSTRRYKYIDLRRKDLPQIIKILESGAYHTLTLNDTNNMDFPMECKIKVDNCLEKIFSQPCKYEINFKQRG